MMWKTLVMLVTSESIFLGLIAGISLVILIEGIRNKRLTQPSDKANMEKQNE